MKLLWRFVLNIYCIILELFTDFEKLQKNYSRFKKMQHFNFHKKITKQKPDPKKCQCSCLKLSPFKHLSISYSVWHLVDTVVLNFDHTVFTECPFWGFQARRSRLFEDIWGWLSWGKVTVPKMPPLKFRTFTLLPKKTKFRKWVFISFFAQKSFLIFWTKLQAVTSTYDTSS